jgi:hypothetical protein
VIRKASAPRDARLVSTVNDACEIVALIASVHATKLPREREMVDALSANLVSPDPNAI